MINGGSVGGFAPMPVRLVDERIERIDQGNRRMPYHVAFLDDYIRGILDHDLVLLGAPTGMGKTELALNIAANNAVRGKRVHYFALEAEPRELERRSKFALISREMFRTKHDDRDAMNYTDWRMGKLEPQCAKFNAWADEEILSKLSPLQTYYRENKFTAINLQEAIMAVYQQSQLIVIDHLHYVDSDDENEARALGDTVKTIRDVSLRIGVPILLVAHLRKRDQRSKQIIATLDDFHGSSNITKIATQVIAIEHAHCIEADKWFLAPTFMSVLKDRRGGACRLAAVCMFDKRTNSYVPGYRLGKISGADWEEIPLQDIPRWAVHYDRGHALTKTEKP